MSGAEQAHDAHAETSHDEKTLTGGAHGHQGDARGESHGHGDEELGPIDWPAWGAAALGVASALVVVAVLYVTIRSA
jgi:hypothetical protein